MKKFKQFYGMSSKLAQEKHFGGMACYRASEGREKLVSYVGSVETVIVEILGGIRSTMSYIGARRLKDIPKCTTFYRVNRQLNSIFENQPNI
jgi:GMP reductase